MQKKIPVVENILSANDQVAAQNRQRLDAASVFGINMMASPGAGKTSLIEQTIKKLRGKLRIAVIEGDIATSLDAERVQQAGAVAVQINTGGGCHLEAHMIRDALNRFDLQNIDLLIVENVGNLVCPGSWKLGTHRNVLVASTPEGHDKPYKYPAIYRGVDTLVINKIDLLPYISFDMETFQRGVELLNPGLRTFPTSCTTGEGMKQWINWLIEAERTHQSEGLPTAVNDP